MQGPFSQELNTAMLRQYDCRYLLTKNSGDAGG
ncbi:MAG: precorrin-6A/cobalt-precorrin-6A reductase [Bianqueaceae bacterium]